MLHSNDLCAMAWENVNDLYIMVIYILSIFSYDLLPMCLICEG